MSSSPDGKTGGARALLPRGNGRLGRRATLVRAVRFRLAAIAYVLRKVGPPLFSAAAYTITAAFVVRWDMRRAGLEPPELTAAIYRIYTQLFFEPADTLPPTPIARLVYWVTPLAGVFLVAEGLLKVGASLFDLATRREVWVSIVTAQMRGHVIVCGLGHVGYRVVEELRRLGEEVIGIEQRETGAFVDIVRGMGIPVLVGDARRDELLSAAGLERAKAVVCATSDDLANLEVALDAKRMSPNVRVVLRMFDQRLAGKIGSALEIDNSFSTSALAAPLIALQATEPGVRAAYRLGDVVHVTVEIALPERMPATEVAHLEQRAPFRVVGRRRAGSPSFDPVRSGDVVGGGDTLVVDVAAPDLAAARAALGASDPAPVATPAVA